MMLAVLHFIFVRQQLPPLTSIIVVISVSQDRFLDILLLNYEIVEKNFKNDGNSRNFSFDINSITNFIIENYKQILLFILVFIIIYVVEHITYYNALLYSLTTTTGLQTVQIEPNKINKPKKIKNKK